MVASLADLKKAVVLRPTDAEARFALAEALVEADELTAAIAQLEKALAIDEGHLNARRLLARAYVHDQRPGEAHRVLVEGVRAKAEDVRAREELADFYLARDRYDDAAVQLREAARLAPSDPERWTTLGNLYARKHLWTLAVEAFEKAAGLVPGEARALRNLELAREQLRLSLGEVIDAEPAPAAEILAAAGLLEPRPDACARAAQRLVAGDVNGAKKALVLAAPAERAGAAYELVRAEIAYGQGDFTKALVHVQAALSQAPKLAAAHRRAGDLAWLEGRPGEAADAYERAVAIDRRELAAKALAARARRSAEAPRPARDSRIGRIGVLAWTPFGGNVSPLEACAVSGAEELVFSGNIGDELRDSGNVVYSALRARSGDYGLAGNVAGRRIHLHLVDTSLHADGRSAGLPLALAAISVLRGAELPTGLAATGEVTLGGHVKAIGGVHEKVIAAYLCGYDSVLVPRQNLQAARDLPPEVLARVRIAYVDSIEEAARLVFPAP